MKGIIFTQLLDMVEQKYSYGLVDTLLLTTPLASGGIYTSGGTYPSCEMVSLVKNLSQCTNIPVAELLREYGRFLFKTFVTQYHPFLIAAPDAFSFLSSVDAYIHYEVKKLYPEAELPQFLITRLNEETLRMVYKSSRQLSDLAYGLIEGTLAHYQENATITQQALQEDGSRVEFIIVKQIGQMLPLAT
ncbi:heme NO-binding domain-containing protein [Spirosoma pulveris]